MAYLDNTVKRRTKVKDMGKLERGVSQPRVFVEDGMKKKKRKGY